MRVSWSEGSCSLGGRALRARRAGSRRLAGTCGTLRWLHVVLVLVIAAQAWLGRLCPLTTWEQQLRAHAGQSAYATSFVEHWLSRLLFLELPWWVFVAAYTAIAALTALGWWRWPPAAPTRRPGRPPAFGE